MDFFDLIIISSIATAVARSKRRHSSSESIENLVYFKDCKHNPTTATTEPSITLQPLREPEPRQPDCPCPRMCCSMCCDCNIPLYQSPVMNGQMQSHMPMKSMMMSATMNQEQMRIKKKKKPNQPGTNLLPPINGRRDFGFTRENIKTLISQDEDIKKILKDLVRVTMKKADLVDALNTRRTMESTTKVLELEEEYDE